MKYIVLAIPVFFALMAIELAWSAWSHRKVYRFNDFVANLGCGIGSQVVGAFTKTGVFAIYLLAYESRLFTLPSTPSTWLLAFLLVDFMYYWFHRLSHQVNFLWAAHIVHHQSEEYNLSVALRQSWWQGLFSFWFYVPVAVIGVHPAVILSVAAINTLYQFWIHTKAIGRMGPFEWLFNTPSHHRVHHGSDPKYIDRNHAGTLIIWDKLFGTFQREEEEPVYGITAPLASWDPLTANFHYWGDLIRLARKCRNWRDRLRVFLKPPGWRPEYLGGFDGPKAKNRADYRKYDTAAATVVKGYIAMQFLLLLGIATLFLFEQERLEPVAQWVLAGLIGWWVMNLGVLHEARRWAAWSEVGRVLLTGIVIAVMLPLAPAPWGIAVALTTTALSLLHAALLIKRPSLAS